MLKARAGRILVVKGERWYRWEEIMGRTLGAGPSVGHPFLCETTTVLCAQSLWQTQRSGRELGRIAFPTVQRPHHFVPRGFPSIKSLPVWRESLDIFDELHTAGERVKQLTVRE